MIDSKNDTNGQELHVLKLQLGESTQQVKIASVEENREVESLESRHFANPADRVFPIHTKSATERSIVYFFGNMYNSAYDSSYPASETEERLKKAARFWDSTDAFYSTKLASKKLTEVDKAYGCDESGGCDKPNPEDDNCIYALATKKLPISTEDQVLKSAKALIAQRHNVAFSARSEAALKILKAAATMGIPDDVFETISEPLQKMAGLCVRNRKAIAESLLERGGYFERAGHDAEVYKSAAASIEKCEDIDIDNICNLIDAYEHTTKIAKVRVNDIEDVFFTVLPEPNAVRLSNGTSVSIANIKSASLAPFYVLGESVPLHVTDAAGKLDLEKAASFLECLPKNDCDIYLDALKKCLK